MTQFVLDWRQIGQRGGKGLGGKIKAAITGYWRKVYALFYDQVCFLHEAGAQKLLGRHWQQKGRIVPLAVDEQFLAAQTPDVVDESDDGQGTIRFLYVGSLSRVRQLERLIEAAELLAARNLDFQLHLIGPDNAEGYYQRIIVQKGLQKQVAVLPAVPYAQIPPTVLSYDVALAYVPDYPADWQYHPTVKVLEYRALGIPILATDFAPNREIVQAEDNGLLVANQPAAWAEGMARFIEDQAFRTRCRARARQLRKGVIWSEVAQQYEALYHESTIKGRHILAT
ncbi:MAG: glycosyltransferase family 4 protein [Caldilineaceae bacterium]